MVGSTNEISKNKPIQIKMVDSDTQFEAESTVVDLKNFEIIEDQKR